MTEAKILTVICAPDWGGLQVLVKRTTPYLRRRGFERIVILPVLWASMQQELEAAGCTVIARDFVRPRKSANPKLLWRYLRGFHADVRAIASVARKHQVSLIEASGLHHLQAVFAAKQLGLPLVWQLHGTSAPRWLRIAIGCLASRWANVIMTSGRGMIARHGGLAGMASRIIPFCAPLDLASFRPNPAVRRHIRAEWGYGDEDVVVGTLGNRGPVKNQEMIVQVARRLQRENFRFAICGAALDAQTRYFESHVNRPIQQLGLSGSVRVFAPAVPAEVVMNAFDIFILTSRAEGASLVTAEAMATALPVVATDVGSLRDLVHDGENGILIKPDDIENAAAALRTLADPALRAKMGRRSREIVLASVSSEGCAAAHIAAYRRALQPSSDDSSKFAPESVPSARQDDVTGEVGQC
jgi:glycosyltransferase involved in cell wall biosynthesis